MLGGLSMTATLSRRNTAPKGGRDGGTRNALSSFIFRIIKGPWANWIILEALYTIDWCAVEWVQPCGCVCMTRLLPFTLLGEWAVFLRIIIKRIGAISLFQGSTDELWNALKVSAKVRAVGPGKAQRACFLTIFPRCVIPLIKRTEADIWRRHEKLSTRRKKMFPPESLTWWKMHETTTLTPGDNTKFPIPCPEREREFIEHVANRMKKDETNCKKKEADICAGSRHYNWFGFC